ncbi:DUF1543 domain-containing protein [Sphingobacterium sp. Mn56C]|uniref:DUF1543 domain-containing protein n=1 Tax=Sphingobacterium sp. Mn56C TaxID=3395261 RepID=UPI003BD64ECD
MHLYMILMGCKPEGRKIEQHDIFFSIGNNYMDFKDEIFAAWPEAKGKIHIDAYRKVNTVGNYQVRVATREGASPNNNGLHLYFLNLGGYKSNVLDEYHFRELIVAKDLADAKQQAKETVFAKNHIAYHVDDKYGIDVDDAYEVSDLLAAGVKEKYVLEIIPTAQAEEDTVINGFFKLF